jgi:hypothetical protein
MTDSKFSKLVDLLMSLTSALFYGTVTIKFEAGKIVHVKKEESLKLDN